MKRTPILLIGLSIVLDFSLSMIPLSSSSTLGFEQEIDLINASMKNIEKSSNSQEVDSEHYVYLPLIQVPSDCAAAPILLEPSNGAIVDSLIPIFVFDSGNYPDATELKFQISRTPDFQYRSGRTYFQFSGIISNQLSWNLDSDTIWYWRVFFMCDEKRSSYSETWSLTTSSNGTILPAPILLSPANNSIVTTLPMQLEWYPIEGAVEYTYHYTNNNTGLNYAGTTSDNIATPT